MLVHHTSYIFEKACISQGSRKGLNSGTQVQEGMNFYKIKNQAPTYVTLVFIESRAPQQLGYVLRNASLGNFITNVCECHGVPRPRWHNLLHT